MVSTSSRIATLLDVEMFKAGQILLDEGVGLEAMEERPGDEVAEELGGRCLLRFLREDQIGAFTSGTDKRQFVTPTPYTPEEAVSWLALPPSLPAPLYVLLLDISKVEKVLGPHRIRLGGGVEYVLPEGFPKEALIYPRWEVEVR